MQKQLNFKVDRRNSKNKKRAKARYGELYNLYRINSTAGIITKHSIKATQ